MQRLRSRGTSVWGSFAAPQLKKRAANSMAAVQDTYLSTKETFENHKVVFTIGTSLASVATAWAGYSLRHYHQSQVEQRLESIEKAMKKNYHLEHSEIKKLVDSGSSRTASLIATAATTLMIGYGLGWRGGAWYTTRKFRREQMKLLGQLKPKRWQVLGQIKPKGWPLKFLRRQRHRAPDTTVIPSENIQMNAPITQKPVESQCQAL